MDYASNKAIDFKNISPSALYFFKFFYFFSDQSSILAFTFNYVSERSAQKFLW